LPGQQALIPPPCIRSVLLIIKRCPECNRQTKSGACAEHGKVEGIYDLRIKAVCDNGIEIRELLCDAPS